MRHYVEHVNYREIYEFTEQELVEKLGLPDDFQILAITGLGPYQFVRFGSPGNL